MLYMAVISNCSEISDATSLTLHVGGLTLVLNALLYGMTHNFITCFIVKND